MIESILGSENAERTLVYLMVREKGYAAEIAHFYGVDLYAIQNQLRKFEGGGILVSFLEGRTRVFEFNPRYIFLPELKALLEKAFSFYPQEERNRLQMVRRRPRRTGKPL
jgi:predicted transcriptional regulator